MPISDQQLIFLHTLPSMTPRILRQLIQLTSDDATANDTHFWKKLEVDPERAAKLATEYAAGDRQQATDTFRQLGLRLLRLSDSDYPPQLRAIHSAPPLLYIRGNVDIPRQPSLAVVGTRQPSPYGLAATRLLLRPVASQHIPIVSGLAFGIDALAHRLALENGCPTIAVVGSGLDLTYPWAHRDLADEIIQRGGALVSEFPLGAKPERHHFPQRNRIISGLSKAVLLVEAGEKSGAPITAKFAVDQNRDVLAVPANITSEQSVGVLNWLKLGASPVSTANDILSLFSAQQTSFPVVTNAPLPADPIEAKIVMELRAGPRHVDVLAGACRLDSSAVSAALSLLELRDLVRHDGGMVYHLNS